MPDIARMNEVAASANLRSKLARWLSDNREEFAKSLKTYRPRWEPLVEWFGQEGLMDLPPEFFAEDEAVRTATRRRMVHAAKRTWARVQAVKARAPVAPASVVVTSPHTPEGAAQAPPRANPLRGKIKPIRIINRPWSEEKE
jgi:hypothetical protein